MTLEQRKKLLLDYKLSPQDYYVVNDEYSAKIIIRRTGIDKIEAISGMGFTIESIQTIPYGEKCCTTIVGRGADADGVVVRTTASANPDNCRRGHHNYAEIAEKRCRHRCLLKLVRLYEFDVYSEIESDDWGGKKNKRGGGHESAVAAVENKLK